jgi:hypothetical protein
VVALSLFTEGLGEFFGLPTQRGRTR